MEEELKAVEEAQGNVPSQPESSDDIPDKVLVKRGRGRPKGSKKPQISVPDVNLMELVSGIANSGPALGFENASGGEDHVPKKRGRPKGSGSKRVAEKAADNIGSDTPKRGRGRPKGSGKRKVEHITSEEESDETGHTDGALKKAPRIELGDGDNNSPNGIAAPRGRGRPRKSSAERRPAPTSDGPKRGRGRPKGSVNKKPPMSLALFQAGRPRRKQIPPSRLVIRLPGKKGKRGRPRKVPSGRGRPRKYPLPPSEDSKNRVWKPLGRPRKHPIAGAAGGAPVVRRGRGRPRKSEALKRPGASYDGPPRKRGRPRKHPSEPAKPKVWKPLGRPRKYPLVDPPEGAPAPPRRTPGRPRKSHSKRGAHLRNPAPSPRPPGRPRLTEEGVPRKRGRPKNSGNKNKVQNEAQPDGAPWNHSAGAGEERNDGEAEQREDAAPPQQREDNNNTAAEEGGAAQE
ncbi:translation initiation factor IF-2 [Phyllopteryx taeniolatus]|uniref:translation initiation factor IF-2 n=1 Tax=Phyllopteryx taeniolatus TaxID=161469 RepID=UPI002AD2CE08|nr:translation initiation factor IF-2 [Phyllopteryx taeniolatus]